MRGTTTGITTESTKLRWLLARITGAGARDVLQTADRRAPDRAGEGRDDRVEGAVEHVVSLLVTHRSADLVRPSGAPTAPDLETPAA